MAAWSAQLEVTLWRAPFSLNAGQLLKVRVKPQNAIGPATAWSPTTPDAKAVAAITHPSAPQNLKVLSSGETRLELSWAAPLSTGGSSVTSYSVATDKARADGSFNIVATGLSASSTLFNLTAGISTDQVYVVSLRAESAYGSSPWTSVSARSIEPPSTPQDLTIALSASS